MLGVVEKGKGSPGKGKVTEVAEDGYRSRSHSDASMSMALGVPSCILILDFLPPQIQILIHAQINQLDAI